MRSFRQFLAVAIVCAGGGCDYFDYGPAVHFVLPDGFRGEVRVEEDRPDGVELRTDRDHFLILVPESATVRVKNSDLFSPWHKERAFFRSGEELPVISIYREQPEVVAMRNLGTFFYGDDKAGTNVYVVGTWDDAASVLEKRRERPR